MHHRISRGFTVLELLVVMAIMSAITTILVSSFPRFGEVLAIDREAQLMALAVRDIEQRAVSTLESPIVAGQYQTAFGVHFNQTDNKRYWLFSDAVVQDNFLTAGEAIETVPIERGARIHRICKLDSAGTACDTDLEELSVTYKRPNPIIQVRGATIISPGVVLDLGPGSYMIEIESKDGSFRRQVIMWTTGAVAIKKTP